MCFSGTCYVIECTGDQTKHLFIATHHPKFLALGDKEIVAVVGVEVAELTLIYVITSVRGITVGVGEAEEAVVIYTWT